MHSLHRKTARTAAAVAVAGLVAALTTAPATAQPLAGTTPDGSVVPMNYTVNAFQIKDGETARSYKKETRRVKRAVEAEGGTVLRSYPKIGVVVAQSDDKKFDDRLRAPEYTDRIESMGATRTSPTTIPDLRDSGQDMLQKPVIEPDPREDEQWGNEALDSLAANEIQPGSPKVLVGVLDSGIQSDHEDLAAAIDHDASVDCTNNGIEDTDEEAWNPTTNTHGTHVAGTIAAQRNGIGVAGIAPGVKLASVKVVNDDGFIFPEYAICGFMWAPKHGIDITNNSYYIDPWMYWCDDNADQGAVQESVRRAVAWTQRKGVLNVAAAGNAATDLANKETDSSSPNDSEPIDDRPIDEGCLDMPTELPGVVTVSATTESGNKASFSNYGDGVIDVSGPGEGILSTVWPDGYASFSGTSMASPHVAGVAALALSEHPRWSPRKLRHQLDDTAENIACPNGSDCTGNADYNGYFGNGQVNALNAVTE